MTIRKEHKEFYKVDLNKGWEKLPGYPEGIQQQVLAGFLDEKAKRGFRTRHLRFAPGVFIVGNDRSGKGGTRFGPNTYACRPPGTPHGPFKSETGCLLLEMHYYDESTKR